ncbi:carbohydrate ABC transporter permease [Paenibacillus sp. S150]|uniref:carbohydrate ABC transporter permease n=1 Tax=Paenibacillus sp. S150 TaxID=2749826 RepID=UPI001C55B33F|nr:carbohydrate ABC transporter permease [Paenibacillus sp. S150]MBW4080159.1 carbohydrate ABC transporter permease [Paenibacillus sp. S150]
MPQKAVSGPEPALSAAAPREGKLLRSRTGKGLVNLLMLLYALGTLYPLYWLMISAFKTNQDFFEHPFSLPETWVLSNITRAWELSGMGRAALNSSIVTFAAIALTLVLGALTAYVLSRFSFRWRGAVSALFVIGMLIPIHSTLVPLFIMLNKVNLLNTHWALILPYTAFELPVAIFVTAAYMTSIPKEIEEAAVIDGSGYWGIFARMILPLTTPALSTVAILAFLRYWNDFAFALVFINKQSLKTIPLSLSIFSDGFGTDYGLTMAAMAISVLPTIVMFLIFQEQIMKGMVAGAVKG